MSLQCLRECLQNMHAYSTYKKSINCPLLEFRFFCPFYSNFNDWGWCENISLRKGQFFTWVYEDLKYQFTHLLCYTD